MAWAFLVALAAAQAPDPSRWLAPDTARAVTRARSAQEAFEFDRRRRLPIVATSSGRCDERIGRFCYWYDERDTSLPKEPEPIKIARARLNASLASAQNDLPSSNWLVGQRIRYLLEHQEPDTGLTVAARCGAAPWWCSALAGLSLHIAERFAAADSAFETALAQMPPALRCSWTDWTVVLETKVADPIKALDCDQRRGAADSLFALAKPLLSEPGNDLRTELLARRTMAALHSFARSPHFIPWGKDMEELMLRYGWSTNWSIGDRPTSTYESAGVTGHQRSPAYQFFPTHNDVKSWTWNLKPERARFRYAPTYADQFTLVDDAQIARFPRGDSTLIVAGAAVGPDTAVALTAVGPPQTGSLTVRADSARTGGLVIRMAGSPTLASLETRTRRGRQVAVARLTFEAATVGAPLVVSDPLFFSVSDDLPETLEAAATRALTRSQFSRETPVGIFWEATGRTQDSLDVAVSIVPIRRGFLGRLGEGLSLVKRRAPLTLQWQARGGAFELDLRRQKPGKYLLRLEAKAGAMTATSQRTFILLP